MAALPSFQGMVTPKTRREKRKHAIVFMFNQSRCDRGQ
jgi:hypothetical protein